jgi:DNA-binding CsgD family transcriptional regulator
MSDKKHGGIFQNRYLTYREIECASWVAQGLTNREIGSHMQLSPRTVEGYIENLKKKLGCYSKVQLITALEALFLIE